MQRSTAYTAFLRLLVLAVCVLPTLVHAQIAQIQERTLFVSAVNERGDPVEGLGPDAFVVREDGTRREVLRVTPATEPLDIALLVDNSAATQQMYSFVRTSLTSFVQMMAGSGSMAVIGLADRPTILADYTTDTARLTDTVKRIFPMSQSGMTLLDAVGETARGLRRRESPRAVIVVVVSDGAEFTNRYAKDAVRDLVETQAAMHAVTVGQFTDTLSIPERERLFLLDQGPRASGGQRISLLTPMGLDAALQRLARELKSQYKVVYGRPQSLIAPSAVTVESARPNLKMRGAPARGENGAARR